MKGPSTRTVLIATMLFTGVVGCGDSHLRAEPAGQLGEIERLVGSAVQRPTEIDRVRVELWPKLALLPSDEREGALEILLRTGKAEHEEVRRFAIESLGVLGDEGLAGESRASAVDWLFAVARDPAATPLTRSAAIASIPELDTSARTTAGLHEIATGASPGGQPQLGQRTSPQEAAIRALGQCGTEDAANRLLGMWGDEMLRSSFGEVILQALAHTGDARTQALLIERIESGDKQSNELVSTIQALGGLSRVRLIAMEPGAGEPGGTAEARATLRSLCEGGYHPDVVATAAIELAGITRAEDRPTTEFLRELSSRLAERDRETLESALASPLPPPG